MSPRIEPRFEQTFSFMLYCIAFARVFIKTKDAATCGTNAMHNTEKATAVTLVDFGALYGTRFLTAVIVCAKAGQPLWSPQGEGFDRLSFAMRPFIFRDAPDCFHEEGTAAYVSPETARFSSVGTG